MPAIFSKNCIVKGVLDYYCLVCCVHLTSEDYVFSHIQTKKHKEIQNAIGYLPKYKGDLIRKAHGVYFCEICNIVMSTINKVDKHVTEELHLSGKTKQLLKRVDNRVVFDEKVFLTDSAWHGLVEDTCILCNVELANLSVHKRTKTHILNLINDNLIIDANKNIYRKVDVTYQCLTCNKVLCERSLKQHLNSEEHKTVFKKCDSLRNIEKDMQCLGFDRNLYIPRILSENETEGSSTSVPSEVEVETLAKQSGLVIKEKNKAFCNTCNEEVLATLHDIEEHVTSSKHKEKDSTPSDTKKQMAKNMQKVTIDEYTEGLERFKVGKDNYVVLKKTICVDFDSFMGLSPHYNKIIICRFCNTDFTLVNIGMHVLSQQHIDYVTQCFVITSLDGEFVRQIKSDLYDCGYCSHTESNFDDMLDHLTTTEHKKRRTVFENLLGHRKKQEKGGFSRAIDFFEMFMADQMRKN